MTRPIAYCIFSMIVLFILMYDICTNVKHSWLLNWEHCLNSFSVEFWSSRAAVPSERIYFIFVLVAQYALPGYVQEHILGIYLIW